MSVNERELIHQVVQRLSASRWHLGPNNLRIHDSYSLCGHHTSELRSGFRSSSCRKERNFGPISALPQIRRIIWRRTTRPEEILVGTLTLENKLPSVTCSVTQGTRDGRLEEEEATTDAADVPTWGLPQLYSPWDVWLEHSPGRKTVQVYMAQKEEQEDDTPPTLAVSSGCQG